MTTEGTYPYIRGGVSVWCDHLVKRLPDVTYHIFAIVPSPKQPMCFQLPANVASCRPFPLWGTALPGVQEARFSKTYRRILNTTSDVLEREFLPAFAQVLRGLLGTDDSSERLASGLLALHEFFDSHDYAKAMQSPLAWSEFLKQTTAWYPSETPLTMEEATISMRWLARYLAILAVPVQPVDVVHASMAGLAGVPGVLAKLRRGTPFLITEHGIFLRELYLFLSRTDYPLNCRHFLFSLNRAIVRMNYAFADQVTTLGDFNKMWQLRFGAEPRKITTVPNGVDPSVFQPRPELRPARPTVVTLARVFPLKGITVLLRAAAIVRQQMPDVNFRILGEKADEAYFAQCMAIVREHNLENNIEWGETSKPAEELPKAHLFCLPSISEGMPFSILEAMLCGLPVVATDVGNVASVLGDKGILARPNDPEDLARALLELLAGPHAAERRDYLAQTGRERALADYTINTFTGMFRQIYEELVECHAETSPIA
ncbi:MAG: GT4 family glycosyltransferase PelF [Bryobacterales bacterium]|nr:GT4 family glycosyltransferase PelF [Bryobacterales bacterium]